MEITGFDGKTVEQATEFPSRETSVSTGILSRYMSRISRTASNNLINLLSKTTSCVGCLGSDLILEAYCRDGFAHITPKLGLCASIYRILQGIF